ncbi:MAG: prepilin-type N-terminal cleavage/methylation domain-containing protein [Ilumatobacteraceae bacterium]|nr:prepilin-type N-terminal cleavage/methylation domain-containing protein [Ilumatobacter sp.]
MDLASQRKDRGFTLVELLVVIVVLGVLATITVFAVRGISDRGQQSACASEWNTVQRAEEAHMAQFGAYADEAGLVSAGLLRGQSEMVDITLASDDYSLAYTTPKCESGTAITAPASSSPVTSAPDTTAAPPTTAPPAPSVTFGTFGGFDAAFYGSGSTTILLVGYGTGLTEAASQWTNFVATFEPIDGVRMVIVDTSPAAQTTTTDINALVAVGSDQVIWMNVGNHHTSDTGQHALDLFTAQVGSGNAVYANASSALITTVLTSAFGYTLTPLP